MYNLLTYNEAKNLVKKLGDLIFYETITYINGFKISTFNYRLARYEHFKEYNAKEMRGLTFVFNKDGSLFKRYLMLEKFWNINETEETQLYLLKEKKIKHIYNKVDGSLISFIKLPDNTTLSRTKMSFDNDQTKAVNKILKDNKKLSDFIEEMLDNNIAPFFEYVSFRNKVVLNYDKDNLILLRLRNNNSGEYLSVEKNRNKGFDVVEFEKYTLDELMELRETLTEKEGWVITFDDDYSVKLKTEWYFEKHKLNDSIMSEHIVIKMILDETIDDVISQ